MSSIPHMPMISGHYIPQFGLGTYKMLNDVAYNSVREALSIGYRHIDTAQMYGNEAEVGRAWKDSGVARENLFITTKLDNPNHKPEDVRATFERSLKDLQTDYVDLFLIHWPLLEGTYVDAWLTMEEFVADGRARTIGVSNFNPHHLENLRFNATIQPAINQIELHPYFQNTEVANYCFDAGIVIEAWSPLARGKILDDPVILEIAAEVGCTPAQLVLAWHMSRQRVVIPKASSRARLEENFAATQINLLKEYADAIDELDEFEAGRTGYNPDTMKRGEG